MIEVQRNLGIFEGNPKHLLFTYDQIALQQHKYEQAGKLVAWSIIHGGPGLKCLDARLYQLMCGVEMDLADFDWRLIPDADVQSKAQKVCFCLQLFIYPFIHVVYLKTNAQSLSPVSSQILSCTTFEHLRALQRELGDWICDCGFPGIYGPNICVQDVPKIYSYIVKHYIYLR